MFSPASVSQMIAKLKDLSKAEQKALREHEHDLCL